MLFEHGTAVSRDEMEQPTKCGPTEHAHIHVVPKYLSIDLTGLLREYSITTGASIIEVGHLDTLHSHLRGANAYHYFEERASTATTAVLYLPASDEPPSQLFRRFLVDLDVGAMASLSSEVRDWRDAVVLGGPAYASLLVRSLALVAEASASLIAEDFG